jgi:hypothetical protein
MFINNPKGVGKRMVVDKQKVKTSSEFQRYRMAGGRGQGRQNGQAGGNGVQKNKQRSKPGGLVKENRRAEAREKHAG